MNGVERKGGTLHLLKSSKIHPNKVNMLRNEDSHKTNVHTPGAVLQSPIPQSQHVHQLHDLVVM